MKIQLSCSLSLILYQRSPREAKSLSYQPAKKVQTIVYALVFFYDAHNLKSPLLGYTVTWASPLIEKLT